MKKLSKEEVCIIVSSIVLTWVLISFIDINLHNLSDVAYSKWNFFRLLLKGAKLWK